MCDKKLVTFEASSSYWTAPSMEPVMETRHTKILRVKFNYAGKFDTR